jgi:hypothetical protein
MFLEAHFITDTRIFLLFDAKKTFRGSRLAGRDDRG